MGFVAPSSSDFQFIIVMFIRLNIVRRGEERRGEGKGMLFCFLHLGGFWFCQCLTKSSGKEEHIFLRKKKVWCLLMCSICE